MLTLFYLGCQKQDKAFSCALACAVNLMKLTISMFIFRTITFLYIAYIQHLACWDEFAYSKSSLNFATTIVKET